MDDIKASMKLIIEQTNNVLKHSASAFKKTKQKMVMLTDKKFKPSEKTVEWFAQRNLEKCSVPDFFELVFSEASEKNYLDFNTQTIIFDEIDAQVFGFPTKQPVHILTFFEHLPTYFH